MGKVKAMLEEDMRRNPHKYEPDPFDYDEHFVVCAVPNHKMVDEEERRSCCGAPRLNETGLCLECKEHADFEEEKE